MTNISCAVAAVGNFALALSALPQIMPISLRQFATRFLTIFMITDSHLSRLSAGANYKRITGLVRDGRFSCTTHRYTLGGYAHAVDDSHTSVASGAEGNFFLGMRLTAALAGPDIRSVRGEYGSLFLPIPACSDLPAYHPDHMRPCWSSTRPNFHIIAGLRALKIFSATPADERGASCRHSANCPPAFFSS